MCPGRVGNKWDRNLDEDIKIISKHNPELIVSIITPNEMAEMKLDNFLEKIRDSNVWKHIHFSCPGKLTKLDNTFMKVCNSIVHELRKGRSVLIHSSAGKHRALMVSCACLLLLGAPSIKIMDTLKNVIPNYTFRVTDEFVQNLTKNHLEFEVSIDWTLVDYEEDDTVSSLEDGHKLSDWAKTTSFIDLQPEHSVSYTMESHPDRRNSAIGPTGPSTAEDQVISDEDLVLDDCYGNFIDPGYETEFSDEL